MTAKLVILLIRAYQVVLSPFVGGACRFQPSCSAYAVEAVATHGAWRGSLLAARRLSRCHPLGRAGFDPVPVPDIPNLEPRSSNLKSLRN
jgi:putative membrane protein insertion efficiency factor